MPRSRPKPTSTPQAAPEVWYIIKDILDERKVSGRVEYLVDWEDDGVTGESYSPSWAPSRDVTKQAKEEWKRAKAARARRQTTSPATAATSQESQSPRPPHRRSLPGPGANARPLVRPRPSATPSSQRPVKKPRLAYSATPSEEPVPSITSAASLESESEPFDAAAPNDAGKAQRLVVELPKEAQFDTADFVSASGTQPSLDSSQSLAELEDRDDRIALASEISRRTIPDSQDPSTSTWSQAQAAGLATTSGESVPRAGQAQPDATGAPQSLPSHIPSRQPAPSISSGDQGQRLAAAATSTSSLDIGASCHVGAVPPSGAESPLFVTQPPIEHVFHLPATSSRSQESGSSSHAAIPATATDKSQPSNDSAPPIASVDTHSQDAQAVPGDDFASQVKPFSTSDSTVHDSPEKPSTCGQSDKADSSLSPQKSPTATGMDAAGTSSSTPPGVRVPAVDDLSQLFDLDNSMDLSEPAPLASLSEQRPSVPPGFPSNPHPSTVQSLQKMVDAAFETPIDAPLSATLMASEPVHAQPPTVSPADVSRQSEAEMAVLPSMAPIPSQELISPSLLDSSRDSVQAAQAPLQESSSDTSSDAAPRYEQVEHVVTLPFQASLRPLYDETLLKSKQDVTEFSQTFNNEIWIAPSEALVSRIDKLFDQLSNICDYPPDAVDAGLADVPPSQLAKYTCDASSKFSFVFELLQGLRKDVKMLIVARSLDLLRLLDNLTEAAHVECICEAMGKRTSAYPNSAAQVTLVLPSENIRGHDFDVVIGFDRSFSTSRVYGGLGRRTKTEDGKTPRVLTLVTTHSIEHIDLHVPEDMSPLERKNVLLLGIARARNLINDPERGYLEPHELASAFVDYFNGESDAVGLEPVPLPDDVLDIYLGTQTQPQVLLVPPGTVLGGRKRRFDDGDEDDDAKKMRVISLGERAVEDAEPPLPDDVQALLNSVDAVETTANPGHVVVKVPLAALKAVAGKFAEHEHGDAVKVTEKEYQAAISRLEQQVKEYEKSVHKIYKAQREALEDRSRFEAEKRKAETEVQAAKELSQKETDKAHKKITELEAEIARLTTVSEGQEENPLTLTSKLLCEAREKNQTLEKRLENAHKDAEYARHLFQEASSSAAAARAESTELREQNEKLRRQTSDGLVKIHQIQAENSARELLRQTDELKTQARERELELDRVREDLRQLKSGRRETRQVSVPRSPRTGMMSPRPGRAYGGSASRGTSPAPALGSDGVALPSGNGRWAHLKD